MKKILLLLTIISSFLFAKGMNDVLEDRVENELKGRRVVNLSNYKVDYDVDVYEDQMNIEIEFEGIKEPKIDFAEITSKLLTVTKKIAPEINDVYIVIKHDPVVGKDKILFSEMYKNN